MPCGSLLDLLAESERTNGKDDLPRRDGWLRAAEGGTLVLDGIDVLTIRAQMALLRAIEEPAIVARRDTDWRPRGVRLVSLANDDVSAPGSERWLEGLIYRLSCVRITVPALRDRALDLSPLVAELLCELTPPACAPPNITERAWSALAAYPFLGNVRELRWAIMHALTLSHGREIDIEHLPAKLVPALPRNDIA